MEQLYSNTKIDEAQHFENEFISKEMNENQKQIVDHPLHNLLRKYSLSRVQMKINRLNIKSLHKKCSDNLSKVWKMEKKIIMGSGNCSDGQLVSVSHYYM